MEGEFGAEGDILVSYPYTGSVTELAHPTYTEAGGLDVPRAKECSRYEAVAQLGRCASAKEVVLGILAADEPAGTDDVDSVVIDVNLHIARPVPGTVGIGVHERLAYGHEGYLGYLVARPPARDDGLAAEVVGNVVLGLVDEGEDSTGFLAQVKCLGAHMGLEDTHLELDVNRRAEEHLGSVGKGAICGEG